MIIDTTNDELLINGQRWQRGGYLLATAYSTDQINITARDGRVIGKAIEWDRILDKDKNTFGLDRDGTVTALTNIFNSQVKSPYKIDALRDVENGTAAYGEIMIYRSPGEWQYEVLEQYHGAYDSEAATLRSGATATLELYYTAQADGDGISELSQSNTPTSGYKIIRKLYYAERAQQDPDTGTWVQFADLDPNTTYASAKATLLAYLKERTGGTVPISLKMTWEEELIPTFLLDDYPGAAAAYSLRKLRTAYTGSAIRVRRASDNAEQDIGFDAGELDTAALASFCSGTDGFVKTWYDQASTNDATQTTTGNQPKIYDSSTGVILENGKPAVEFDGSNDGLQQNVDLGIHKDVGYVHLYAVHASDSGVSGQLQVAYFAATGDNGNSKARINFYKSGNLAGAGGRRLDSDSFANVLSSGTLSNSTQYIHSAEFDFATSDLNQYINGSLDGTTTSFQTDGNTSNTDSLNSSGAEITIGCLGMAINYFDGTIQELVIYNADQSSNRSGIETDINDYYSIYP